MSIKIGKYIKKIYFNSDPPRAWEAFLLTDYIQTSSEKNIFFYKKNNKHTKIINLNMDEDKIFSEFKKNTRNEIRKAEKYELQISIIDNTNEFVKFYNKHHNKGIKKNFFDNNFSNKTDFVITSVHYNKKPLAMHCYLSDLVSGRARLLYSVSNNLMNEKSINKNIVGISNRYLHHRDILWFKNNHFRIYDFGGYAYKTNDKKLLGINKFKDCFGGDLIKDTTYRSIFLIIITFLKKNIKQS